MKTKTIEDKFEDGEEVLDQFHLPTARRPNRETRRVNVDFPSWMVDGLDEEAARIGVTRQSIIKMWLSERLGQALTK